MYKRIIIATAIFAAVIGHPGFCLAAPSLINLQGRLADPQGNPIKAPTQVDFYIYQGGTANQADSGTVVYKERVIVSPGPNGEYSHQIGSGTPLEGHTLTMDDFDTNQDVFLQMVMQGTPLLPRLKFVSNSYAFVSIKAHVADTVVPGSINSDSISSGAVTTAQLQDGAVTVSKLDAQISGGIIPPGLIAMFAQGCPSGWSHFSPMDDHFPMGASSYSGNPDKSTAITGLTTEITGAHSHTVNPHTHGVGSLTMGPPDSVETDFKSTGGAWAATASHKHPLSGETAPSSPGTDTQGAHTHVIDSDGSWRPPYLGVVFCQKN
jgi:hypothetical protein